MESEDQSYFAESKQKIDAYIQDRVLLIKLQTAAITARLSASLFTGLVIALLCFFILLFISIMGGFFFASITGSMFKGFGIIAAFYLLLLIVLIKFLKKPIEQKIADSIVTIFFEKDDSENEENK